MIKESVDSSENGVQLAAAVRESLESIRNGAQRTNDLVAEIASAAAEQAEGIGQMNNAVTQLDRSSQDSATKSRDSADVATSLNQQVSRLRDVVEQFQLPTDARDDVNEFEPEWQPEAAELEPQLIGAAD